jgi:hypothetical protein
MDQHGAWGLGGAPGDTAASGRPPAPGFMRVGEWRFGITVVPVAGRARVRGHLRDGC